jgi:hypothetical protein
MSQTGNSQGSSSASDLLMSQGAVDSKDTQCSFDIVEKKVIENLEELFNGNTGFYETPEDLGDCKTRNETETKQNKTKRNETQQKRNETKRNETQQKRNKIKQKRNRII